MAASGAGERLRTVPGIEVLGPVDCAVERLQNKWRRHLLLKLPAGLRRRPGGRRGVGGGRRAGGRRGRAASEQVAPPPAAQAPGGHVGEAGWGGLRGACAEGRACRGGRGPVQPYVAPPPLSLS